jgi:hypothetical protein
MDGSPSQGDRSLRKATDPYDPTMVHITLLVVAVVFGKLVKLEG